MQKERLAKRLKRAFTITELVIVIAVIAILAAVLIPTFSNVIEKANLSSAMQSARNVYEDFLVTEDEKGKLRASNLQDYVIISGDYAFVAEDNQFNTEGTKLDDGTNGNKLSVKLHVSSTDTNGWDVTVTKSGGSVTIAGTPEGCKALSENGTALTYEGASDSVKIYLIAYKPASE